MYQFGLFVSGDFVRANGLQEGDFIVIYSDAKCGKYVCVWFKFTSSSIFPPAKVFFYVCFLCTKIVELNS